MPVAVVLQGTGAVLLLASLITISAVLWGVLPAWGQVILLTAAVATIGAATILVRRTLPTTSTVLAILTAASALVVLASIPAFSEVPFGDGYPAFAAVLFCAVVMVAGRLAKVRLWWLIGVASTPGAALLVVLVALGALEIALTSDWELALATLTFTPLVVVMFGWSRREAESDPVTSATAWWSAAAGGLLVAGAAIGAALLVVFPTITQWGSRPSLSIICVSAAALALSAWWAALRAAKPLAGELLIVSALFAGTAVTATLVGQSLSVVEAGLTSAAVLGVLVGSMWGARHASSSAGRLWLTVFGRCLAVTSLMRAASLALAPWAVATGELDVGQQLPWAWLTATLIGLGLGAVVVGIGLGAATPATMGRPELAVSGWLLAVGSWTFGWVVGLDSWGGFEAVTVPAGALAVGVVLLARRRGVARGIPIGSIVLATVAPTYVAFLGNPEFVETADWWHSLAMVAVLGLVAAWPIQQPRWVDTVAFAAAQGVPLVSYLQFMAQSEVVRFPEVFVVPVAVAVALVTVWVVEPRTLSQWWRSVQWPLFAVLVFGAAMAVLVPFATGDTAQRLRVVLVVAIGVVVALLARRDRVFASSLGIGAVVVVWWNVVVGVEQWGVVLPEGWSLPSAVAVGGVVALVRWGAGWRVWLWPVWGSVLVVGVGPSVVAALVDPWVLGGWVVAGIRVVGVVVVLVGVAGVAGVAGVVGGERVRGSRVLWGVSGRGGG